MEDHQAGTLFKVPEEFYPTPYDFAGFTASGRHIAVEAKMVERASLSICTSPGLSILQWQAIQQAHDCNCIALICWWRRSKGCALFDIDVARTFSEGRKSIPWGRIPEEFVREDAKPENLISLIGLHLPRLPLLNDQRSI